MRWKRGGQLLSRCRRFYLSILLIARESRTKYLALFYISIAQDCDCLNQQNLKQLEEVLLMGNWLSGKTDKEIPERRKLEE